MNNENSALFLRTIFALFLAVQVWVWLRFAGVFWLTDSWGFMLDLLKSVDPLRIGVVTFLILVAPALVVTFLIHRSLPNGTRLVFYALLGSFYSALYLFFMAKLNLSFIGRQLWVYLAAGGAAGLTYAAILDLPWRFRSSSADNSDVLHGRRKLLGSIGLLAGGAGFLGVLAGPFYFWKNRNEVIDVNVDRLEDGQMLVVEIGTKPVWILKRSPDLIRSLEQDNPQILDPRSEFSEQPEQARNALRSIRPEYFVAYGICTHLGCSPSYRPDGRADEEPRPNPAPQFFCPCHGGVFDLAGRVFKGTPPPKNLTVPNHEFISESVIRFYFPSLSEEWNA